MISCVQEKYEVASIRYAFQLAERMSKALKFISRRNDVPIKLEKMRHAKSKAITQRHN
jgi:hypothetical protein